MNKFLSALGIIGSVVLLFGIIVLIDDNISSAWCTPGKSQNFKSYFNGPLMIVLGILMGAYPLYLTVKKWRKEL